MGGNQFAFKQFVIRQDRCAMKVGTDGVLLGAWAHGGRRILDVGTGTGLIALMMAQRFPQAEVWGIDIDGEAVEQARENVGSSMFADRVQLIHRAVQDFEWLSFDAIVSNPPYFDNSLKNPDSRRALARHTDSLSFRALLQSASRLLTANGVMSLVLPVDVLQKVDPEIAICGFFSAKQTLVKTKTSKPCKRVLLELSRRRVDVVQQETVCLMDDSGGRSDWYRELTKDFYIR